MTIKESIRRRTRSSCFTDKAWHVFWWFDVRRRMLMYSDYEFALKLWKKSECRTPDLEHPKTFNEKLWFLKLSNRDLLLTKCSDKHEVREYVRESGYADILKEEFACYENANEIDFASLPSPCYLKLNNASGMNLVWRRDAGLDVSHIRWKLNFLLKQNPYWLSREWNYKDIPPRIVCEELIEMPDGSEIPELQFFCFNGKPRFIMYNMGLADDKGHHKQAMRWVFDMEYRLINVETSQKTNDNPPPKPKNFEKMISISQALSGPFPHVRVDLFNVEGKIYFNEMTFYSGGGFVFLKPEEWQLTFGEYIDCSGYKIASDALKRHRLAEVIHLPHMTPNLGGGGGV